MLDELIFSAPLAPHTADVAELLFADHWDIAARVHELASEHASKTDLWLAGVLLAAPWDQVSPEQLSAAVPRETIDIAELLAAGHPNAALNYHEAHVKAEFERQDLGDAEPSDVDMTMAGLLLESTWKQARADGLAA
jgi:endo-1,4-beta-D-glucanase Y